MEEVFGRRCLNGNTFPPTRQTKFFVHMAKKKTPENSEALP